MKFKNYLDEVIAKKVKLTPADKAFRPTPFSTIEYQFLQLIDDMFNNDWTKLKTYNNPAKLLKDLEKYDYEELSSIMWQTNLQSDKDFLNTYKVELSKLLKSNPKDILDKEF